MRITRDSDPTDILICILFYDEKLKMNFTCEILVYIIIIPLQCGDISVTIYSNVVGRTLIRKSCQHRLIIIRRSMKYWYSITNKIQVSCMACMLHRYVLYYVVEYIWMITQEVWRWRLYGTSLKKTFKCTAALALEKSFISLLINIFFQLYVN